MIGGVVQLQSPFRLSLCIIAMLATATTVPGQTITITTDQARESTQWLAGKLASEIPRVLIGEKDWGKTKSVWSGVHIRREGWEVRTHRKKREINHGRWVKYELRLPQEEGPQDGREFIQINSVTPVVMDPAYPSGAWRIASVAQSPVRFLARIERWNLGVQLWSVEVIGKLTAKVDTQAVMAVLADYSEVPPAIEMQIRVESASIGITAFEVEKISKLGGDLAEEIGELAEAVIRKVWLKKENDRFADRLNSAIAKHQKDLRWSPAAFLDAWTTPKK